MPTLKKFRALSLGILIVLLSVSGSLVYYLDKTDHQIWSVIIGLVSVIAILGCAVMLVGSYGAVKQEGDTLCISPDSLLGHIAEGEKDFCPIFYKASAFALLAGYGVIACLGVVVGTWSIVYGISLYIGVNPYISELVVGVVIVMALYFGHNPKVALVTKVFLYTLGACIVLASLVLCAIAGYLLLANAQLMWVFHILAAVAFMAIILGAWYMAENWEQVSKTRLGRVLRPVKTATCVPMRVCKEN